MCVKLNSLFDSEKKVYNVTQVLKQGINIKMMCPNYMYILEFRNTNSHLLQVYLGAWAKIETVIKIKVLVIVIMVFKRYPSTYCLIWTFYLQIRITTFKYGYKQECTCTFKFKRLVTPLPSFLYNLQCLIMFWDSERTRYIILNKPVKDYNKVIIHVQ